MITASCDSANSLPFWYCDMVEHTDLNFSSVSLVSRQYIVYYVVVLHENYYFLYSVNGSGLEQLDKPLYVQKC